MQRNHITNLFWIVKVAAHQGQFLGYSHHFDRKTVQIRLFDDQTAIEVDCDPTGRKLGFRMSLGPVMPDREAEMYKAMLSFATWN